ncbi:hypothetical protein N1031_00810 [Herbiconiux moechotypicola]|uniref:Uncharacterized protein n=1 Tax=Herbiconiux moechotypicola TaxID=637393 RepID=A0ABN3D895_9MICO|nr:hypothetical protein [Herbiconiux moechotypicola]MCS5728292.1 hypothetical protein [Herbiconiux moechotypicola]
MAAEHTTSATGVEPGRFDVREFARTAVGSHRSEIDLEAFAERPLDPATVRLLAYARELERSTMTYLRNVLVTPTHKDARVTAFLTTWAFEKYWIADSFEVIVKAHGQESLAAQVQQLPRLRALGLELAERATPIVESFRANSIGTDVIALHLASVTVDEWIVEAAYRRLAELDPHPVLVALLEHVATVKARHRLFVVADTERRLAGSKRARSLARRGLRRIAWPIGASSLATSETTFFYEHLLDGQLATEVDGRVRGLPGLEQLSLVADARAAALTPGGPGARLARRIGRTAASIAHRRRPPIGRPEPQSTTTPRQHDGDHA